MVCLFNREKGKKQRMTITEFICSLSNALKKGLTSGEKEIYVHNVDENKEFHKITISLDIFENIIISIGNQEEKKGND